MRDEPYRIRRYAARDRRAVRAICFETGSMGSSIAPLYADAESFADMFTSYYTDEEPESSWVLERTSDGAIVGYLLGCVDSRRARSPVRIAAKHALGRGLLFRPGTAGFFGRAVLDILRDGRVERPRIDLERYPAHLHMNLLAEARHGYGFKMYEVFETYLRSCGVPGVHCEVGAENARVRALNARTGFTPFGEAFPALGARGPSGERQRVQIMVKSLEAIPTVAVA
ncbi:MAG: hypothetical protein U0230_25435 [Polyangiales bacterium]